MTDLRLVSDCWPTVSAGVVQFPLARVQWARMPEEQAEANLKRATAILESELPHRQRTLAREILERLATVCPHTGVRQDAALALYLHFGDGTEPPSAA